MSAPLPAESSRPTLRLLPGHDRRLRAGHPWVFSNELAWSPPLRGLAPGTVVRIEAASGRPEGTFFFNPHSLIAARRLDRDPEAAIDRGFVAARLERAAALRARLFAAPYHRLCHAEGDGLPGLVIDRYGDVLVTSHNTAGMAALEAEILAALAGLFAPAAVVARDDSHARALEGLPERVAVLAGTLPERVVVEEGGVAFPVDPLGGQKTGWFYDQRFNRDRVAALAAGARVLDVYCHTGAFGLRCAAAGAAHVTLADRSGPALALAAETARANGLAGRIEIRRAEAFGLLERLAGEGGRFDLVVCDPPAFAKSRKDHGPALKGYEKLARLAAAAVAPGGFLFLASCSHHVAAAEFAACVARGLARAGREGRILRLSGAGPDHPVHPHLPESAYLKAVLLQLD
ncbi:class I SAM-dependent rRNA methyltransferase [Elioraea sp.]|uniref:class I SAM-dependent rRNA methyltransferase n=1 Tax=Elioraea sp. TaxID=2185103 RepID=UPI0021DD73B0|nr:class I SAM-dependent rRNA methyltransferase [Elioraea sp.]GIX08295.1 MAG: SAM-dependent methyltransferase [Elioraea sp.]